MKNLTIGFRIIAGFTAVILIAAALGLFALNRAAQIGKKTDELSSNYYPSVLALDRLRVNVYHAAADLLELTASSDPDEIAALNAEIASIRAANQKELDFYETTPFTPEKRAAYNEFKAARADFWRVFEEVQKQGQATDPEGIAKAQKMFAGELKPIYAKYAQNITKLAEVNSRGASAGMVSIQDAVAASTRGILLGLSFAIAISLPIAIFIVRSITRPLARAVKALDRIAGGDLTESLDVHGKDEVGRMAASLNAAVGKLCVTLREVGETAVSASSSSQELAAASETIASGSQQQAASLEQTAASLEQITATVRQNSHNAREASQLASGSGGEDGRSHDAASAVAAMQEISAASARISDIISTVDEIAFQTNLLAVNAAVEAARAGEDGKGFAVVASEVRSLAQRSAAASKEIKGLIQDSLRKVARGSDLVQRVTQLVEQIASASEEQSAGIEQVNTAMTQMDQVTQANAAQTEELSSTAQVLSQKSAHLLKLVGTFKVDRRAKRSRDPQAAPLRSMNSVPLRTSEFKQERAQGRSRPESRVIGASARSFDGKASNRAASVAARRKPLEELAMSHAHKGDDASFEEF